MLLFIWFSLYLETLKIYLLNDNNHVREKIKFEVKTFSIIYFVFKRIERESITS